MADDKAKIAEELKQQPAGGSAYDIVNMDAPQKEAPLLPKKGDGNEAYELMKALEAEKQKLGTQGVTPAPENSGIETPSVPQAGGKASGKRK
jgi:hypothetical protein